jgi:uncharacterized membrane protein YkoI
MGYKTVTAILAAASALDIFGEVYAAGKCGSADGRTMGFINAAVTIAQAIDIAEKHVDGKAIGTGTDIINDERVFYVEVMKHGLRRKVIVDLQSGCVVNNSIAGRYNI